MTHHVSAQATIEASAREAGQISRDRLLDEANALRALQGAQANLDGIKRQLDDFNWAGSWHLLEEELPDAEYEVRVAERDLAAIRGTEG
ncbi:MAG: hypothetical protein KGL39_59790 [Patescibacteria group bacterium]|nr:hypothetical protein [Patescibacteria group bacterium]